MVTLKKLVKLYEPLDGSGYNCKAVSKEMGTNSSNLGLISYKDGVLTLNLNFRFVNGLDEKEYTAKIKEANKGFTVKIEGTDKLLYFSKDSVLVKALLKAYRDETGDLKSEPLAIGGGT